MSNIVMDMSSWTARKTPDNKVSVVDVIAHIRGVTTKYAATMYRRLCDEDRVPKCATEPLPPRADSLGDTICTLNKGIQLVGMCPQKVETLQSNVGASRMPAKTAPSPLQLRWLRSSALCLGTPSPAAIVHGLPFATWEATRR